MISNYEGDIVKEDENDCKASLSFCGTEIGPYPDSKAMGYPFDRLPRDKSQNSNLENFMTPNMKVQDCSIVFKNDK